MDVNVTGMTAGLTGVMYELGANLSVLNTSTMCHIAKPYRVTQPHPSACIMSELAFVILLQ